jgi:hypothetical protein
MASTIQELEQILQRIKEVQVTQVQLKPLLSEKYSFIPCYKASPYTQLRSIPEFPLRAVSHRYNLGLVEALSKCF